MLNTWAQFKHLIR